MSRHPNQQRQYGRPLIATIYPFGREVGGRLTGYELRSATGAVLQAHDKLEPLLKFFGDKTGCQVVRCKDQVCVWPPEAVTAQGSDST